MDRWCDQVEEFVDGALSGDDRVAFDAHLEGCAACRAEIAECETLREMALSSPPVEIPTDFGAAIRARVEKRMAATRAPIYRLPSAWAAAIVTAAAVVLLIVLPDWNRSEKVPPIAGDRSVEDEKEIAPASGPPSREPHPEFARNQPEFGKFAYDAGNSRFALSDWLDQAKNAAPGEAALLMAEARELGILALVREALTVARGAERRQLLAVEDVLIQIENRPSPEEFAAEIGLVARLP